MIQAKRSSTHKQYNTYIIAWQTYCADHGVNPSIPSLPQSIDFLEHIRHTRSLGYNALNTARSALSSILPVTHAVPFGQHPLVKLYMRGVYNIKPPTPRYVNTWDPDRLLVLLKQWSPADTISLKLLTFKVLTLSLLVTGQRVQTMAMLDIDNMFISQECISFQITQLLKQSRPGYSNPAIEFHLYPRDSDLCIYTYLAVYIRRTSSLRLGSNALFISFQKPHSAVSKATLARWLKTVMALGQIDTQNYGPHSIRSASTSAALRGGGACSGDPG